MANHSAEIARFYAEQCRRVMISHRTVMLTGALALAACGADSGVDPAAREAERRDGGSRTDSAAQTGHRSGVVVPDMCPAAPCPERFIPDALPARLIVSDGSLYWSSDDGLMQASTETGVASLIYPGEVSAGIGANPSNVYFVSEGKLFALGKQNNAATVLAELPKDCGASGVNCRPYAPVQISVNGPNALGAALTLTGNPQRFRSRVVPDGRFHDTRRRALLGTGDAWGASGSEPCEIAAEAASM